jgi:hypothetical protein
MRKLMLLAGATAMALGIPSMAYGQGKGRGGASVGAGHSSIGRGSSSMGNSRGQGMGIGTGARIDSRIRTNSSSRSEGVVPADTQARTDSRASVRARTRTGASVDRRVDANANGIPDFRERPNDVNGDGIDDRAQNRYGGNICPPGLVGRTPACIPPGQATREFREGQRIPDRYQWFTEFAAIPESFRDDIPDSFRTDGFRYIFRNDVVYVVDRSSGVVTEIIDQFD